MMSCIGMLLKHNFTCRKGLMESVGELSDNELHEIQDVGWDSIHGILVHLINTEQYWIRLLQDEKPEPYDENDLNSIEEIKEAWMNTEKAARKFLEDQTDVTLQYVKSVQWGDRLVSFTVAKALIHMATHETHHRGLIVGLSRKMGYEPPQVNML